MEKKNNLINLVNKHKFFYIYLNNKIFFKQIILCSNRKISNKVYTYFYVLKIMYRFGLVGPISKTFGY